MRLVAIITLLLFLFPALTLAQIVRDADSISPICPSCGHINVPEARFCSVCGTALQVRHLPDSEDLAALKKALLAAQSATDIDSLHFDQRTLAMVAFAVAPRLDRSQRIVHQSMLAQSEMDSLLVRHNRRVSEAHQRGQTQADRIISAIVVILATVLIVSLVS